MDRFLALQAFVRVAETGSFAAAARSLFVSNPVVSERIRQLEELVGRPLFYRTTRTVSLTEAGAEAFPIYLELMRKMDDIENVAPAEPDLVTGKLRVASVIDFGLSHVAPALSKFAKQNPKLIIEFDLDNRLVNPVAEGFDIAIHFRRLPLLTIGTRHLLSVANGYFAAPSYVEEFGVPTKPNDLREHRCIGYSLQANTDAWNTSQWDVYRGTELHSIQVSLAMMANSGYVLKKMVMDGHGIAVLPIQRVHDEVSTGKLMRILPQYHPKTLSLSAVFPASHAETYKVQRLVSALITAFEGNEA